MSRERAPRATAGVALALGVSLLLIAMGAACTDGTTPNCADPGAKCGPIPTDAAIPDTSDGSQNLPDARDADAASPGDSASDATDATPDDGGSD